MIFDFAYLTLVLALILCCLWYGGGILGRTTRHDRGRTGQAPNPQVEGYPSENHMACPGGQGSRGVVFTRIYAVCGLVGIAAAVLWYGLLTDQFQISYVWNSSERSLPTFYKFAAIWGGQAGSLLFWTLLLSLFSTATAPYLSDEPAHSNAIRQRYVVGDSSVFSCPSGLQRQPL